MDFTTLTVEILRGLAYITGGYGWAIIFLTVLVRLAMWPLSVSQQRSMKKMQELSPKLKQIQERYKSDPQVMQKKMMEFYKEHNFNPFGGCFPLLIQMPVFIMLYAALVSPQFIELAGNSSFMFINRLDTPIRSHAGEAGDKSFGVDKNDSFSSGQRAVVYTDKGIIKDVKIKDTKGIFLNEKTKKELIPGETLTLKANLDQFDLPFSKLNQVKQADITVINNNTKEVEHIKFDKSDSSLIADIKTEEIKTIFNYDVLFLVLLFGVTMFFSQKAMTSMSNTAAIDPSQRVMQEQMAKIMPVMITSTFIFFPIPAGVLLYMIASNVIQIVQTIAINKQLEKEVANKPKTVVDKIPSDVKKIEEKSDENSSLVEQSSGNKNSSKKKKDKKNKW